MASAPSQSIERLGTILTLLDIISADEKGDTEQLLTQDAIRAVKKLQDALEHSQSQLQQVVDLVLSQKWSMAMDAMRPAPITFPGMRFIPERFLPKSGGSSEKLKEVLALIGDKEENLESAIKWVEHLDAELQAVACDTLYETIKRKGFTDRPLMVQVLLRNVGNLPVGVLEHVQSQLEDHSSAIIDSFVKAIKQKDFELYGNKDGVFDFYMPEIVNQLDVRNTDSVLLLIEYNNLHKNLSLALVSTIFNALERNHLLGSEQAMQLYMHMGCVYNSGLSKTVQFPEFFVKALERLDKMINIYFVHYQRYVELEDKQKLKQLHHRNPHLEQITKKFIPWYYNGDPQKTMNILYLARNSATIGHNIDILHQLWKQMEQKKHMDTFEAFCLYNQFYLHFVDDMAPDCVKLLLRSASVAKQLRLICKLRDMPMCLQQNRVICCNSGFHDNQNCFASVDNTTALTTFSFYIGNTSWQLDASDADGVVKVTERGHQWKLKVADQLHFKIFTKDDMFLTLVDGENSLSQRVCLQEEIFTNDTQLWRIALF